MVDNLLQNMVVEEGASTGQVVCLPVNICFSFSVGAAVSVGVYPLRGLKVIHVKLSRYA